MFPVDTNNWLWLVGFTLLVVPAAAYMVAKYVVKGILSGRDEDRNDHKRGGLLNGR